MIELVSKHAPVVALLGFFVFFLGMALWTYWPRNKARIEAWRYIPLREREDDRSE